MTRLFSRWLPCATLIIWSLVLLYFADAPGALGKSIGSITHLFSGRVDAFLIPTFRPYVLLAGLAMAGMAAVFIFFPADAECCSANECGHPLSRFATGKWLTFLILIMPVAVAARVSPDGFGKNAMMNRGVVTDAANLGGAPRVSTAVTTAPNFDLPTKNPATAAPSVWPDAPSSAVGSAGAPNAAPAPAAAGDSATKDYLTRTPDGHIVAEVLDLLYAAQDNVLRKDFEGKTVELIGQLMPDSGTNAKESRFKAVRMFMTCCAADARPVATLVEASAKPALPEMSWIKITGTATFPIENGRRTAVIRAERVEKTEPPPESMLY